MEVLPLPLKFPYILFSLPREVILEEQSLAHLLVAQHRGCDRVMAPFSPIQEVERINTP